MNAEPQAKKLRPPSYAERVLDAESVRESFEEARPRSREDIMLDIRFSHGHRKAFNYAYLARVEFEPGDTLRLLFGSDIVRIEGRRLLRLYDTLTQHRARFVQEGSAAEEGLKPDEAPHIDRISVEELET